jgi:acyl carrier protein phosphodiesterase
MAFSKQFETYPQEIQNGITLHRAIDTFTDAHPVLEKVLKVTFRYHHYAGVIVDVYDHFLAKNWNNYSDENLEEFIEFFTNH